MLVKTLLLSADHYLLIIFKKKFYLTAVDFKIKTQNQKTIKDMEKLTVHFDSATIELLSLSCLANKCENVVLPYFLWTARDMNFSYDLESFFHGKMLLNNIII